MLSSLSPADWNFQTAAHLLNRAGFGGSPAEVEALHKLGLEGAVNRLLSFTSDSAKTPAPGEWASADPQRAERLAAYRAADPEMRQEMRKEEQRDGRQKLIQMRQWWLERMRSGPQPLQEKLTLFWHGHFATSIVKVKDSYLMWEQNELFRHKGAGAWQELLTSVSQDPAMLMWLDQGQSRKQHPNENYARELLELFTLGEGNYTEKDVTEAARALTGWSYDRARQVFVNRPLLHDRDSKTIFGKTGDFRGDHLISLIVAHPQSARYITAKLWRFFAGQEPSTELNDALAANFRKAGNIFVPTLKTIFMAREFYAPEVIRNQVKSPVQWLIGACKQLEIPLPPADVTQNVLRTLGQDLFVPPNVKGWDGGLSWITTNNLLTRNNFAAFLVTGENPLGKQPIVRGGGRKGRRRTFAEKSAVKPQSLVTSEALKDAERLVPELEKRFLQGALREKQRKLVAEYLSTQGEIDADDVLHAIRLIMCTPDYQLA